MNIFINFFSIINKGSFVWINSPFKNWPQKPANHWNFNVYKGYFLSYNKCQKVDSDETRSFWPFLTLKIDPIFCHTIIHFSQFLIFCMTFNTPFLPEFRHTFNPIWVHFKSFQQDFSLWQFGPWTQIFQHSEVFFSDSYSYTFSFRTVFLRPSSHPQTSFQTPYIRSALNVITSFSTSSLRSQCHHFVLT